MKTILGEMEFDIGFKKKDQIVYFGETKPITIKLKAYYEKDGITKSQEKAMQQYCGDKSAIDDKITNLLTAYSEDAKNRFIPRTLLFERKGEITLLCDDKEELDEGIAVCLFPKEEIISQDDYL